MFLRSVYTASASSSLCADQNLSPPCLFTTRSTTSMASASATGVGPCSLNNKFSDVVLPCGVSRSHGRAHERRVNELDAL